PRTSPSAVASQYPSPVALPMMATIGAWATAERSPYACAAPKATTWPSAVTTQYPSQPALVRIAAMATGWPATAWSAGCEHAAGGGPPGTVVVVVGVVVVVVVVLATGPV